MQKNIQSIKHLFVWWYLSNVFHNSLLSFFAPFSMTILIQCCLKFIIVLQKFANLTYGVNVDLIESRMNLFRLRLPVYVWKRNINTQEIWSYIILLYDDSFFFFFATDSLNSTQKVSKYVSLINICNSIHKKPSIMH